MGARSQSRKGSLQFWPRKKADKFLPRVNWGALVSDGSGLLGFIGYKAGMKTAIVKDNTPNSMTKNKKISIPVTIIEVPPIKIYSVRFYKGQVIKEIIVDNSEKFLKRIVKLGKTGKVEEAGEAEDVRIIVYSVVSKTGIKKTPDLTEVGLAGSLDEKLKFIKEHIGKEIPASEVLAGMKIVDIRGLTKGKGFSGPVKRFGIKLKSHKSEKGRRRPGSLGPWHPHHVIFRVPMAGQLGMFTRVAYNNPVIKIGKGAEIPVLKNFGKIRSEYVLLKGSVQGPQKRQVLLTSPLRINKIAKKINYEFLELA